MGIDERLRVVVEAMVGDYRSLGDVEIFRIRQEFFERFYKPTGFRGGFDGNIVFVDSGHTGRMYSTDAFNLSFLRVGGIVRSGDRLEYVGRKLGGAESEAYVVYGSISREGFRFLIYPIDDAAILLTPERALEVSDNISALVGQGLDSAFGVGLEGLDSKVKYFSRIFDYLVSLIELAYCIRVVEKLSSSTCVLDGSLVRWFGAGGMGRRLGFDGLDLLSLMTGLKSDALLNLLDRIVGLAKTTKFTTLARSRRLLSKVRGGYGLIDADSLKSSAGFLKEIYLKSKNLAVKLLHTVTTPVFDRYGVYALKTPVSVDGVNVYVFGKYLAKPLINHREGFSVDEKYALEVSDRLVADIESVFARITRVEGYPPYGFLEVDKLVRLSREYVRTRFEPRMIYYIREYTGGLNHPLVEIFRHMPERRLGYLRWSA
ncbi:hypothetical protein ACSU1N_00470 [Thermogladius sp. 4427co]|uniref:hypothetical protein n=1 Tax=Thermogladius sp. 4427co TaxID=3450718 RepID=UPI003F7A1A68